MALPSYELGIHLRRTGEPASELCRLTAYLELEDLERLAEAGRRIRAILDGHKPDRAELAELDPLFVLLTSMGSLWRAANRKE